VVAVIEPRAVDVRVVAGGRKDADVLQRQRLADCGHCPAVHEVVDVLQTFCLQYRPYDAIRDDSVFGLRALGTAVFDNFHNRTLSG